MANCRLMKLGLAKGSPGSQQELATITGELRQSLSLAVHKANQSMVLERVQMVGDGAQLARRRRKWDRLEDTVVSPRLIGQFGPILWRKSLVGAYCILL